MPVPPEKTKEEKTPKFTVVQSSAKSENKAIEEFGFDPGRFSKAGNSICVFCGMVADSDYVKQEAQSKRMSQQLMAVVCTRSGEKGKIYLSANDVPSYIIPDNASIQERIQKLCEETGLTIPDEPMDTRDPTTVAGRGFGITKWYELFTPRQLLTLMTFTKWVRQTQKELIQKKYDPGRAKSIGTSIGLWIDSIADYGTAFGRWKSSTQQLIQCFDRQAIEMVWDFPEANPFGGASGDICTLLTKMDTVIARISSEKFVGGVNTTRGSATQLPYSNGFFDAVITDPPYYNNVSYAALSDLFYVWLKRRMGHMYPDHFASDLTPKRSEAIADFIRHGGQDNAKKFYEETMFKAFQEMYRVLKPMGILTMVYAHKTVAGWSTLVNSLRKSGFVVTEAWPLETEMGSRLLAMETSALASSIFIVARKRSGGSTGVSPVGTKGVSSVGTEASQPVNVTGKMPVPPVVGNYADVKVELEEIVRERVKTLWEGGITGADLIIACVGAGLKAYTQYERVELPNGEEVSSERFLREVEGVVQETILEYLFGSKAKVSSIDLPTRFYILWRYAYGRSEIDAGEAIVFSYPLGVELDGPQGLSTGRFALLHKKGKKYRLKDYTERGQEERLGLEARFGTTDKPLIDVLHRLLWLIENRTLMIQDFLDHAMPNTEELRLVAQALSGSSLQGGGLKLTTDAEQSALQKLLSNWRSVVEDNLFRKR